MDKMNSKDLLQKAMDDCDSRPNEIYGAPGSNNLLIAQMWSTYTGHKITVEDVAAMRTIVEIAYVRHNPKDIQPWKRIAGFAAKGAETCAATERKDNGEPDNGLTLRESAIEDGIAASANNIRKHPDQH